MEKKKIIAITLTVCCIGSMAFANDLKKLTMRERVNNILAGRDADYQATATENDAPVDEIQQLMEETKNVREQIKLLLKEREERGKEAENKADVVEHAPVIEEKEASQVSQQELIMPAQMQGYEFEDNYDSSVIYDVTPPPEDDAVRYDYDAGSTYQVYCRPGFTTDIQLQKGEKVLKITAGDKTNWEYRYLQSTNGYHLYISPVQMGLETNIIIITDKHNYQLRLSTDKQFYPIVRWNYPQEYYEVQDEKNIIMEVKSVDQLDFSYSISQSETYPWTPETVFSDGFRTFIRMPQQQAEKYRPLLMIKKNGKWVLAQYAIKNDAIVVGEIFTEAMLMIGNADNRKIVRIVKNV